MPEELQIHKTKKKKRG